MPKLSLAPFPLAALALIALQPSLGAQWKGTCELSPPPERQGSSREALPTRPDSAPHAVPTGWRSWWELHQHAYLAPPVMESGRPGASPAGWPLRVAPPSEEHHARPRSEEVRRTIVPELTRALDEARDEALQAALLIALARVGDAEDEAGREELEELVRGHVGHGSSEVREAAVVALGVLGHADSVPALSGLVRDTRAGGALVASARVPARTRALAAYALGLIGHASTDVELRAHVEGLLVEGLALDAGDDLAVACLLAGGLLPLEDRPYDPPPRTSRPTPLPDSPRAQQLQRVLVLLGNTAARARVRAHAPITLVRLVNAEGARPEHAGARRRRVAEELLRRLRPDAREDPQVVRSCLLALGQLALPGTEPASTALAARIQAALREAAGSTADEVARARALLALAQFAGMRAAATGGPLSSATLELYTDLLERRSTDLHAWAALGAGLLARRLDDARSAVHAGALARLRAGLRKALEDDLDGERLGSLALACGLARVHESAPLLRELLQRVPDTAVRGDCALALGMLRDREACEALRTLARQSRYRPRLLRSTCLALGLLRDPEAGRLLSTSLAEARGLATLAATSTALADLGDRRGIAPLVELLHDDEASGTASAFAARALGRLGHGDATPWYVLLGHGVNHLAAPTTLHDPQGGVGLLDRR